MLRNNNETTPDIRKLILQLSDTQRTAAEMSADFNGLKQTVHSLLQTRSDTPAAPVANLLWNGEIGHSVNSWHDSAYVVNDSAREAAWWFSHNKPATKQDFTTITVDNEIPLPAHNFTTGQTVDLVTTTALPSGGGTPPVVLTTYYVYVQSASIVKLATNAAAAFAGTPDVTFTAGTGSGTHTIQERMLSADARAALINNELKATSHSTYTGRYSRWNSANGWAELNGTMSVDHLMPSNACDATTPLARVSFIAAKKNAFIEIPTAALLGVGIWDNTSLVTVTPSVNQRKFLTGDIGFTAEVIGTPAATVERRYRVLITSDRGYSLLSPEVTVSLAPRDTAFTATDYVSMTWRQQAGQLQVDIYEYLPTGGNGGGAPEYRLVQQVSAATSYIHLGSFLPDVVTGYPTSTGTVREATYFTETGEMVNLATDGVSPTWNTINFPIGIPNNYNKALTLDRQWVRIWMTVAANLYITGVTTDGSTAIAIPTGAVNSAVLSAGGYGTGAAPPAGSLYFGLVVEVYDSVDALLSTTSIASVTSDTVLVLAASVAAGSNRKIRIVGGGFHGIVIDKIHLGYHQNTSYAPNDFDNRFLQPVAAPTSSTQGGTGTGGSGGGINTCVVGRTPIKTGDGKRVPIESEEPGNLWATSGLRPAILGGLRPGFDFVRRVRSANGIKIECTDTERFVVSPTDLKGMPLFRLRVGDKVMTEIDGKFIQSRIAYISEHLEQEIVYTPSLGGDHVFIGGELIVKWPEKMIAWLYWILDREHKQRSGGFVLHNTKPLPQNPGE